MTDGKDTAFDLSALGRRQALSEPERRRLDLCLASSEALRALHEIGCDFDQMDASRAGDQALIRRVAERAKQRSAANNHARNVRRSRPLVWLMGATVLVASLGAAAAILRTAGPCAVQRSAHSTRVTPGAVPRQGQMSDPLTKMAESAQGSATESPASAPAASRSGADTTATDTSGRGLPAPATHVESQPSRAHENSSSSGGADSASALFALANSARRSGELDRSLKIYRELEAQYPGSPEAALSHVMVGRLHLMHGQDTLAVADFGRYLRAEPKGALAQEALEGKARALQRLGRTSEERIAWKELLIRYPKSIYSETARERLGSSD